MEVKFLFLLSRIALIHHTCPRISIILPTLLSLNPDIKGHDVTNRHLDMCTKFESRVGRGRRFEESRYPRLIYRRRYRVGTRPGSTFCRLNPPYSSTASVKIGVNIIKTIHQWEYPLRRQLEICL